MVTRREFLLGGGLASWFKGDDYELDRLRHEVREVKRKHAQDIEELKGVLGMTLGEMAEMSYMLLSLDYLATQMAQVVLLNNERLSWLEQQITPPSDGNRDPTRPT